MAQKDSLELTRHGEDVESGHDKPVLGEEKERIPEARRVDIRDVLASYCQRMLRPHLALLSEINNELGPSENIAWVSLPPMVLHYWRRLGLVGNIIGAVCQTVNQLIGAMVFLGLDAGIILCYWWVIVELVPMKYRYLATLGTVLMSTHGNQMAAKLAYAFNAHTGPRW
ncbi:hypothetical protein BDV12DRAFT_192462 [Aspergillus spectabilis]